MKPELERLNDEVKKLEDDVKDLEDTLKEEKDAADAIKEENDALKDDVDKLKVCDLLFKILQYNVFLAFKNCLLVLLPKSLLLLNICIPLNIH